MRWTTRHSIRPPAQEEPHRLQLPRRVCAVDFPSSIKTARRMAMFRAIRLGRWKTTFATPSRPAQGRLPARSCARSPSARCCSEASLLERVDPQSGWNRCGPREPHEFARDRAPEALRHCFIILTAVSTDDLNQPCRGGLRDLRGACHPCRRPTPDRYRFSGADRLLSCRTVPAFKLLAGIRTDALGQRYGGLGWSCERTSCGVPAEALASLKTSAELPARADS